MTGSFCLEVWKVDVFQWFRMSFVGPSVPLFGKGRLPGPGVLGLGPVPPESLNLRNGVSSQLTMTEGKVDREVASSGETFISRKYWGSLLICHRGRPIWSFGVSEGTRPTVPSPYEETKTGVPVDGKDVCRPTTPRRVTPVDRRPVKRDEKQGGTVSDVLGAPSDGIGGSSSRDSTPKPDPSVSGFVERQRMDRKKEG